MNFQDQDELMAFAGEYVLGVLSEADRAAVEHELRHNRVLAVAVAYWQDRLLEMAPAPLPVAPAADAWQRIEGRLAPVAPVTRVAPTAATTPRPKRPSLWDSMQFWRAWAMGGALATVLLALVVVTGAPRQAAGPQYVVVLEAPAVGARWVVQADATAVRLIPVANVVAGPHQSLQFWTKPQGAAGPTSLGLVAANQRIVIPASRLPALGPNQLFEVTLEPEAGSPLGRPTGPVLAVGRSALL